MSKTPVAAPRKRGTAKIANTPASDAPETLGEAPAAEPTVSVPEPAVQEVPAKLPKAARAHKAKHPAVVDEPAKTAKPVKASKLAKMEKAPKPEKPAKIKLVRDSFTMPESDYANLALLKQRCLEAGVVARKSELLRLGLQVLAQLPSADLAHQVETLERLKTGRPAKH